MDIDPHVVKQATPGLFGALGAVFLMKGSWLLRVGMVIPGAAGAYFAGEHVAKVFEMPPALAGFLVGLLGMIAVAKIVATWDAFDLSAFLWQFIPERFRPSKRGDGQ